MPSIHQIVAKARTTQHLSCVYEKRLTRREQDAVLDQLIARVAAQPNSVYFVGDHGIVEFDYGVSIYVDKAGRITMRDPDRVRFDKSRRTRMLIEALHAARHEHGNAAIVKQLETAGFDLSRGTLSRTEPEVAKLREMVARTLRENPALVGMLLALLSIGIGAAAALAAP